jgi:endonuclease/exonuclease/phosphatase family metal-dependent hydrolase
MNGDTIRIYNLHLESIRFGNEDYSFYSHLTEPDIEEPTPIKEGSKRMLSKLRTAFVYRSKQVAILSKHIAAGRYPVILAGDFNDTPSSFTYQQLTRGMTDSFIESGHGLFMSTYAGKLPSFRIDYILHSDEFRSILYKKFDINLSDHYPITTTLVKIP